MTVSRFHVARMDCGAEEQLVRMALADITAIRTALVIAFTLNAGLFVGEMAAGFVSGSMGLVADALDMGADASVYAINLAVVVNGARRILELSR